MQGLAEEKFHQSTTARLQIYIHIWKQVHHLGKLGKMSLGGCQDHVRWGVRCQTRRWRDFFATWDKSYALHWEFNLLCSKVSGSQKNTNMTILAQTKCKDHIAKRLKQNKTETQCIQGTFDSLDPIIINCSRALASCNRTFRAATPTLIFQNPLHGVQKS